jgi:uridine kinase
VRKPCVIGIAGPSGAGKSELARLLARELPGGAAQVSLDSYYRPMDHLTLDERAHVNFDHPDSLDWDLIRRDVDRLARGESILEPVYMFDQHTRANEVRRVDPGRFVILEGLFVLYDEQVRSRLSASIFVDARPEVCLERRICRDVVERGRTRESVLEQYARTVAPMAAQYLLPTRRFADLVVSGENPLDESWAAIRPLLLEAA